MKNILENIYKILPQDSTLLLGISGGVDSMALLDIISQSSYKIVISHINHGLREESKNEAKELQKFFEENGYVYEINTLPVLEYVDKHNVSVELAARELRHELFNNQMQKYNCSALVLGHHSDDRIETFLFNLMRGSTIHGLHSMDFWNGKILRPFYNTSKEAIISYASGNNLKWFEDHTNSSVEYDRNWLRNEILPALEKRKAGVRAVLSRTIEHFSEADDFINFQVSQFIGTETRINISELSCQHKFLQKEILRQLWINIHGDTKNMKMIYIDTVLDWYGNASGGSRIFFGNGTYLTRSRGFILEHKTT